MGSPRETWSLRRIAQEAGVLPKVARDAVTEGVIDPAHLREGDVLLVRLYAAMKRLVWPDERRPANKDQGLRIWESLTVETARAAVPDEISSSTGLFVHSSGCILTNGPAEYCQAMFRLADRPFYYLPIGLWYEALPSRREIGACCA